MKIKFALTVSLVFVLLFTNTAAGQNQSPEVGNLQDRVFNEPTSQENATLLQKISDIYFEQKDYSGFVEYLNKLKAVKNFNYPELVYYYIALSRAEELRFLESKEDWGKYYEFLYDYHSQIDAAINEVLKISPNSEISVDAQYLNWLAKKEEEAKDKQTCLAKLIEVTSAYTVEHGDVKKLKDVATALSNNNEIKAAQKLYSIYVNKIMETLPKEKGMGRLFDLAKEAYSGEDYVLSKILYSKYLDLAEKELPKEDLVEDFKALAVKFADCGWIGAHDSSFAEDIYLRWEEQYGLDSFDEVSLYIRAYNLYKMKAYGEAAALYKVFIDKFAKSSFIPEVFFRLGMIKLYYEKNADEAVKSFNMVANNFKESYFAAPCVYQAAAVACAKKLPDSLSLYKTARILSRDNELTLKVDALINALSNNNKASAQDAELLNAVLNTSEELATISAKISVAPTKTFPGNPVKFLFSAQDFGLGSVQPMFNISWNGDVGTEKGRGNIEEFSTIYESSGAKLVQASASYENRLGWDFQDIIVYDLNILGLPAQNLSAGKEVELKAEILPYALDLEAISYIWKISAEDGAGFRGKFFKYKFAKPGLYQLEVTMAQEGQKLITKTFEILVNK